MTDLIVETPRGRVHQYIPDGIHQVIYIRPYGTFVRRPLSPETIYIGEKIASLIK